MRGARIQRGKRATALAWHPTRRAIACGWETGHLTVHDVMPIARVVSAVGPPPPPPSQHDAAVTDPVVVAVAWTSAGSRLLAGYTVSRPPLASEWPYLVLHSQPP